MLASVQLPDSASLERTREVVNKIDTILQDTEGVSYRNTVAGQSFVLGAYSSNFQQMFFISTSSVNGARGTCTAMRSPKRSGSGSKRRYRTPSWRCWKFTSPCRVWARRRLLFIEDRGGVGLDVLLRSDGKPHHQEQGPPGGSGVFPSQCPGRPGGQAGRSVQGLSSQLSPGGRQSQPRSMPGWALLSATCSTPCRCTSAASSTSTISTVLVEPGR